MALVPKPRGSIVAAIAIFVLTSSIFGWRGSGEHTAIADIRISAWQDGGPPFVPNPPESRFRSGRMISRTLAALGDANLTDHDIQRVQTNLSIRAQNAGSTDMFRVVFRHRDGRYARELLETHLKIFLASETQRDLRLPRMEVQFLSDQLREAREELSRLEAGPTEREPPLYAKTSEPPLEPPSRPEDAIMERAAAREKLAAINRQLSIVKAGLERNETTIDDRFMIVTPVRLDDD